MSEKAETRAAQSAKDSRATTAKVSNLEGRVAWLEQDAPEPFPVLPKQAERVEQQDVIVPQPWQVRAFDTTDRTNPNNPVYKAEFKIYNPVLFFNGVPQTINGIGSEWNSLNVATPLSESLDVVVRVTYTVDAEEKRTFKSAEIATKKTSEQEPEAEEGQAIDEIKIATLHGSGWTAITQHQVGAIYLGGSGGTIAIAPQSFEVQMWDYQYSTRKVGIRGGAWDSVDWLTEAECEEIGEDTDGAPKLVFRRSYLTVNSTNAVEGHPEFKDITYFFQNLMTAPDDHVWEVFISRDKTSSINGLGLQILETTESELRQRFAPPHIIKVAEIHKRDLPNIKRYVGDVTEEVSEGGINLYKITNAGSSGEVYDKVNATGEVYDANCSYALISRWRRVTKQSGQTLCNEEIKNATSTFVPLESHASDHTNGVL